MPCSGQVRASEVEQRPLPKQSGPAEKISERPKFRGFALRRNPDAVSCAEHAVSAASSALHVDVGGPPPEPEVPEAMSLGLEALNSALSCAEARRALNPCGLSELHGITRILRLWIFAVFLTRGSPQVVHQIAETGSYDYDGLNASESCDSGFKFGYL